MEDLDQSRPPAGGPANAATADPALWAAAGAAQATLAQGAATREAAMPGDGEFLAKLEGEPGARARWGRGYAPAVGQALARDAAFAEGGEGAGPQAAATLSKEPNAADPAPAEGEPARARSRTPASGSTRGATGSTSSTAKGKGKSKTAARGGRKTATRSAGRKSTTRDSTPAGEGAAPGAEGEGGAEGAPKAKSKGNARDSVADAVREEFLRLIDDPAELEKPTRWRRNWNPAAGMPRSGATDRPYRGMNALNGLLAMQREGYADPRFWTFKGALEAGHPVLGGGVAKGKGVEMYAPVMPTRKPGAEEEGAKAPEPKAPAKPEAQEEGQGPMRRGPYFLRFYAFNAKLLENPPPLVIPQVTPAERMERVYRLVEAMAGTGMRLSHGGTAAYYSPFGDSVTMPPPSSFESMEAYASTLLHEVGHATGHKDRMAREFGYTRNNDKYALEELVAEPLAVFACASIGIEMADLSNHQAYVIGWRKMLREDPSLWTRSVSDAQKAHDYLMKLEEQHMATRLDDPEKVWRLRESFGLPRDPALDAAVERVAGALPGAVPATPDHGEPLAPPAADPAAGPAAPAAPAVEPTASPTARPNAPDAPAAAAPAPDVASAAVGGLVDVPEVALMARLPPAKSLAARPVAAMAADAAPSAFTMATPLARRPRAQAAAPVAPADVAAAPVASAAGGGPAESVKPAASPAKPRGQMNLLQ